MIDPIDGAATSEPAAETANIDALLERIVGCVTDISRGFDRWDDPSARGPGLYFVVARDSLTDCTVPMGTNRWPIEDCATVFAGAEAFRGAAQDVAVSQDGAVVVQCDGTIGEAMVRVTQLAPAERRRTDDLHYPGWMGARHMSALETSTRNEVFAAITLSEEDGRVTVFTDGTFEEPLATPP